MDPEDCEHDNINENGFCMGCYHKVGIQFDTEDDRYAVTTTPGGTLETNVGDAPPEVMTVFRRIQDEQQQRGNKIRRDKKNAFILMYISYVVSEIEFNPVILAKHFGFTRVQLNCCMKNISGSSLHPKIDIEEFRDKIPGVVLIQPSTFIESICKDSDLVEYEDELREKAKDFIAEHREFLRYRPQHVACGIVKNFCDTRGIKLNHFTKKNDITDANLKLMSERISKYL